MIVGAYIRCSTPAQMKESGPERQEEAIRAYYATAEACEIRFYLEPGISADDLQHREELRRLLGDCATGDIHLVAVDCIDRLARDVFLQAWIEKELARTNTPLVAVSQSGVNGDDPTHRLLRQVIAAFAEYEKTMLKHPLYSGRKIKASKGGYAGGSPGLGYRASRDEAGHSVLVQDKEAMELLKYILTARHIHGAEYKAIATELNKKGIPTSRKDGGRWHASTIRYICHNPKYRGLVQFAGLGEQNCQVRANWVVPVL